MTQSTEDLVAESQKFMQERSERVRLLGTQIGNAVAALNLGIIEVHLPYRGYGDEGSTECLQIVNGEMAEGDSSTPKVINCITESGVTVQDAMDEIFCLAEEIHFDGWENGTGASGVVIVDVRKGTVRVEHSWIIEATEDDTFDFALPATDSLPDSEP